MKTTRHKMINVEKDFPIISRHTIEFLPSSSCCDVSLFFDEMMNQSWFCMKKCTQMASVYSTVCAENMNLRYSKWWQTETNKRCHETDWLIHISRHARVIVRKCFTLFFPLFSFCFLQNVESHIFCGYSRRCQ